MKLPRYWRYGAAAVLGFLVGAVGHGPLATAVGVGITFTLIVALERGLGRGRPG